MRLVLFGDSYADPLHNPSGHAWMHKLVSLLGGNSFPLYDGKHVTLYSNNRPIGQHTDFGDLRSYALQGSSIEYSQAQFLYYLNNDYDINDILIFTVTNSIRLPFIGDRFREDHGLGHTVDFNHKDYEHYLFYISDDDLKLKVDLIATIMNGLENKKVLLNSFTDIHTGFDFHLSGTLFDRSGSDIRGVDKRSNHLSVSAALELAHACYHYLKFFI